MNSLSEITEALQKRKSEYLTSYPIKSMAIFGSYARNEQEVGSDIDILVEFSDNIGIRFIDLADDIEKYLGIRVDLVSRKGIKPRYFESIKSDLVYV